VAGSGAVPAAAANRSRGPGPHGSRDDRDAFPASGRSAAIAACACAGRGGKTMKRRGRIVFVFWALLMAMAGCLLLPVAGRGQQQKDYLSALEADKIRD